MILSGEIFFLGEVLALFSISSAILSEGCSCLEVAVNLMRLSTPSSSLILEETLLEYK